MSDTRNDPYSGAAPHPESPHPQNPYPTQPGAPAYPGGPGFYSPPPKKRRTGLIAALCAVAMVVVLGAAIGGVELARGGKDKRPATVAAPSISTSVASPSPSSTNIFDGPTHSGDLRRYLIAAPKSSEAFSKPLGSHNSFTAKQESKMWGNPAFRRSELSLNDFTHGAVRQWKQVRISVTVELFQFSRPINANAFYVQDSDASSYFEKAAYADSVTVIPHAELWSTNKKDKRGDLVAFAIARCGDVVVEMVAYEYKASPSDLALALLRKQYQKLCP